MAAIRIEWLELAIENDDDDLVHLLLQDLQDRMPRGVTYDATWPPFDLNNFTDDQCWSLFRFYPTDIHKLCELLQLPEQIVVVNRCTSTRLDAMCMVLRRFAYPNRLCDLERLFSRPTSTLSMIINKTIGLIWTSHRHRLTSLNVPWLQPAQLQEYADVVHAKGEPLTNCFGFIDGTVRPICRPTRHQRVCYNGHKRVHALKFQSVVTPNGLIANLYGPMEGRRHGTTVPFYERVGSLTNSIGCSIAIDEDNHCVSTVTPLIQSARTCSAHSEAQTLATRNNCSIIKCRVCVSVWSGSLARFFGCLHS